MPKVGLFLRTALAVLATGLATVANAGPVPLDFTVEYGDGLKWEVRNPEGNATADDFSAEGQFENEHFTLDWNISGQYDPSVSAGISVTNNLGVPQTFTFITNVPVPPIAGGTLIGGSVGGSFTDVNGGGAEFDSSGATAIYTAYVDGVEVATLLPAPIALVTADAFLTELVPSVSFGTPIPFAPGPAALNTDIGLQLKFTLSPGDTAALTSVFVIEPVPEPSSVVLALMGLACGLFVARRRARA